MVTSHLYEFGVLPLPVHDEAVQGLANGAVLATVAWMASLTVPPPTLVELAARYILAPAYRSDPSVQHVRVGPALVRAGVVTCLDAAIYTAARSHVVEGVEAWVVIVRHSDHAHAHAIVVFPDSGRELDPSLYLEKETPR